jgi:hypothetical protein
MEEGGGRATCGGKLNREKNEDIAGKIRFTVVKIMWDNDMSLLMLLPSSLTLHLNGHDANFVSTASADDALLLAVFLGPLSLYYPKGMVLVIPTIDFGHWAPDLAVVEKVEHHPFLTTLYDATGPSPPLYCLWWSAMQRARPCSKPTSEYTGLGPSGGYTLSGFGVVSIVCSTTSSNMSKTHSKILFGGRG